MAWGFPMQNMYQQQPGPQQMLQQLRANPVAYLRQAGMDVPDGMNDPQQIINHLLQSGQVSNQRLAQLMGRFRR